LTFSTLLSSQGAGAHRIKGLSAGHRGNSLTLPVDLPPVKRAGFGSPGLPLTDTDRSDANRADGWGKCGSPRDRPPRLVSVPPSPANVENPTEIDRSKSNRYPGPPVEAALPSFVRPAGATRGRFHEPFDGARTAANVRPHHPRQHISRPGHSRLLTASGSLQHPARTWLQHRRPPDIPSSQAHAGHGDQLSGWPALRRRYACRAAGRPTAQTSGPARRPSPRGR